MKIRTLGMVFGIAFILVPLRAEGEAPWMAELEQLANKTAKSLQRPCGECDYRDESCREFDDALHLARDWPHELFREPLLALLRTDRNPLRKYGAAMALVHYRDPRITAELETYRDSEETLVFGCFGTTLGRELSQLLEAYDPDAQFLPAADGGLAIVPPPWGGNELVIRRLDTMGMTIPRAAEAVDSPHLSVRLQAMQWCSWQRIILDADALVEAWSLANEAERLPLLGFYSDRLVLGKDRLRSAYERIAVTIEPRMVSKVIGSRLAFALGKAGSPTARRFAFPIIHSRANTAMKIAGLGHDRTDEVDELAFALEGVIAVADLEDLADGLMWIRSQNELISEGAYCVLVKIDDPRADEAVISRIRDPKAFEDSIIYGWPYLTDAFLKRSEHAWRSDEVKWLYLRAWDDRAQMLANQIDDKGRHDFSGALELESILACLSAPTGVHFGVRPGSGPGGLLYAEDAVREAGKWHEWVMEHDPKR